MKTRMTSKIIKIVVIFTCSMINLFFIFKKNLSAFSFTPVFYIYISVLLLARDCPLVLEYQFDIVSYKDVKELHNFVFINKLYINVNIFIEYNNNIKKTQKSEPSMIIY